MIWMKNGEELVQEVEYGDILPSGDGTYQTWVSVELDPQSRDIYSCHVEHCGHHMVLQGPQGKDEVVALWRVRMRNKDEQEAMPAVSEGRVHHCPTQCALEGVFHVSGSNTIWSQSSFLLLQIIADPRVLFMWPIPIAIYYITNEKLKN